MNKKEFDRKFNKAKKETIEKFTNENMNKLMNKIINEFIENPDDFNLALANTIAEATRYSLRLSTALIKNVLEEMLVDEK